MVDKERAGGCSFYRLRLFSVERPAVHTVGRFFVPAGRPRLILFRRKDENKSGGKAMSYAGMSAQQGGQEMVASLFIVAVFVFVAVWFFKVGKASGKRGKK